MTKSESNNWLEPFRRKQGYTQEALAAELKVDKRMIGYWEHYARNNIPFEDLAKALKVTAKVLKQAYDKGLYEHRIQELKNKPINKQLFIKALNDCKAIGLTAAILEKMEADNVEDAASKIEAWVKAGNIQPIRKTFNQLIKDAVLKVTIKQEKDLEIIEQLIANIAMAAVIPHDQETLENNPIVNILGAEKAWSIRLVINASVGGLAMTGIKAISSTALGARGGVKIEETTEDQLWRRVHQIIANLVDELFMTKESIPELDDKSDHSAFRKYCKETVNEHIENTNEMDVHCFVYSLVEESNETKNLLVELIASLRIYICGRHNDSIPVLHLEEIKLESWIALNLLEIEQRREYLNQNHSTEGHTMKNNSGNTYEIHTHGQTAIAFENSTAK